MESIIAIPDRWRRTGPGPGTGTGPPQVSCCSPTSALLWPWYKVLCCCFPGWLRGLTFLSSGDDLEWTVPHELGKRRVNTQFTPSSDFCCSHLTIKITDIHSAPAINKTLSWVLWERYKEEWIMAPAHKDSFYGQGDRHISHTMEYDYNKKQIVISAITEVVQVKCSGTTRNRK